MQSHSMTSLRRIMKLRISKKRHRIHNIKQMEEAIREEWKSLTPADWEDCVKSMQKRCRLVIKAKGGSTKYRFYINTIDSMYIGQSHIQI